ncbi:sulfite exporter TauE/SafE family protein [Myxococcus xanthus]|uniref:sulfite exporter TauE/SafE family protein n=1 Tax=Myxococcus xanthus TaxID=34 RepID=UPI001916DC13|nr:sulfite exporter TauE/SafE family protein [Myxococcus xanthus]QQR46481.1 sulfite exporter TauE/SafE family protein [Myxococcus xanthus]
MPSSDSLLVTVAVFVLAGLVKGVVGLGLPTIAMALLALVMPPARAAVLLIVPSLVTNVWQLRPWSTLGPLLRRLARMQVGVCVGTLVGAWVLGAPVGAWATVSLGVALVAYAAWGLSGVRFPVGPVAEARLGPWVGALTGFVTAATGVFVIPAVPYLQALGFEREELIQAMGISFTVSTLALAAGLYVNAAGAGTQLGQSLLMLLPALVGMQVGQWLRQKLSPVLFRACFLVSLMLLGMHMVAREMRVG